MAKTKSIWDEIRSRVQSQYPLLFLRTFEEERWEKLFRKAAPEMDRMFFTWSATAGADPLLGEEPGPFDPVAFLEACAAAPPKTLFYVKDLHPYFSDPRVVRKLRDIVPNLQSQRKTLLLIGPSEDIPMDIVKEATGMALPLPDQAELAEILQEVLQDVSGGRLTVDAKQEDHMVKAVLGLTGNETRRAFTKAVTGCEAINDEVYAALVSEKRHMVQGSDLLEFFDLEEGVNDIGGLEGLKDWLAQRSEAFSKEAQEAGLAYPKGVLLAGIQGCGKSLSAKAIARLLGFPLVRMDMSNLLSSTRGSSEHNLREVLHLMETIAPSVLWLEEIDKAFSGYEQDADATVSRLIARFLTWLQEHRAPVFVVATANNVAGLPPELLRRGRFDEMFFIDLPNFYERKQIFTIHTRKRNLPPESFNIEDLSNRTDGYSGAEIEQIVNSAVIECYGRKRPVTQKDLIDSTEATVPLSVTMEDKIFDLREWARTRCRPATPDSRLGQVLDEEQRRGDASGGQVAAKPKWQTLAASGQLETALVEYIRAVDAPTFVRLVTDFAPFTEVAGDYALVLKADPKLVIWTRLSQPLTDLIANLVGARRMYLHPVAQTAYAGTKHPTLPFLSSIPESEVAKPHWLPTTLRIVPAVGASKLGKLSKVKLNKPAS